MKRIVLTGTATVNANGTLGVLDVAKIKYPGNKAILIDQIVFANQGPALGAMQVSLKVGKLPITAGYVPVALFGEFANNPTNSTSAPNAWDVYNWRLPKPILVPAGEILDPTFFNQGKIGLSTSLVVQITYFARVVEPHEIPNQLWAPWVASWESVQRAGGADYTDQTTETDLYNNTESPLYVERLMGVIASLYPGAADRLLDSNQFYPEVGQSLITIQVVDSQGVPCVRDAVPFSHLFDQESYSWRAGSILPPGGYYLAFLDLDLSGVHVSYAGFTPMISLVGHREITRKDYGL